MTTREDVLRYTSDSHAKTLLRGLYRLRLTHELHDIWLCVGSQRFAAHRNVLAAASDYFNAMFLGGLSEVDQDRVEIHGISADVFKILLEFIYTGDIEVTESNCQDVLMASDMLGLSDVVDACCTFLKQQLHPSNCVGIFLFAESHNCISLSQASENYIHAHFMAVTEEEEYIDLTKDILVRLLQSENLIIDNELQVFEAAMKWIEHDVSQRRRYVFDVLAPVRFPIVSLKQLHSHIERCGDLSLKIALRKLMQDFCGSQWQPYERRVGRLKPYLLQPRKCARKNMYVIGGYSRDKGGRWSDSRSLSTVECFNSFQQQWTKLTCLRHPRSGHGIAVLDGCIYVIGGESDSLIFDNTECFNPATQKWTMIPSMTVPRCGLGVCACDNKIYAFGGWIGSQIGDTVERFDPELNRWIQVDHVRTLRFAMGVIEYKGLVYVVGGMSELGTEMNRTESYNPVTQEWCQLSAMLTSRAYIALAALDGCLYAVGGWNEDGGALSTVEKYSIEEDSWTVIPSLSTGRAGATATAVNGLLYVIGGRTSNGQFSAPATLETVECYDPQTDDWFYVEPMPTSRCEATVVVL